MADGKIPQQKELIEMDVTFTFNSYGLWNASTKNTYRILASTNANYLITADGTGYVRIFDYSTGSVNWLSQSDSPKTIRCIVIPI